MKSKYFRLIRPIAWITFLFPFSVGLGLGLNPIALPINILLGFFSFICWMSFSFIVNAIGDKEVDKIHDGRSKDMNLANQPISTGEIAQGKGLILSIIFLILSLLSAWLINTIFFVMIIFANILGYIYSMPPIRFKAKPVGDVFSNAFAAGAIFTAGLSVGGSNINIFMIIEAIIMASIFYLPTVLTDIEFDRKVGLKTSAIFLGAKNVVNSMFILTILLIAIGLIIFYFYNIELKILVILMIIYSLIFISATKIKLKGEELLLHENWILIPFFILSLIFIIYGILKMMEIIVI
jgi:4-hydroxybenzoate polyprenyltransferase